MTPEARAGRRILYVTDGFAPHVVGGMQAYARRQLETIAGSGYELVSISTGPEEPAGLGWRNVHLTWPRRSPLRRLSPWRYVGDLRRFSEAVCATIDAVAPDLVYSEGPLLHAWLHRPARAAPAVFNPHGLEMYQDKGSLLENLNSWPLRGIVADHARRADAVACLSERGPLQRILRDTIGVAPERIAVLPNAAPPADPHPRTPGTHGSRFLFVGRDEPRKALPLLLAAFACLDGAELDVVGTGPRSGAGPAVRFHGEVRDRDRLRRFYEEADFLVVPSHAEGMPTVVLEAFAQGLPVIATDVGASSDAVREGETGLLLPRGDVGALADAMRRAMALAEPERARLSAACAEAARTRFSAGAAAERLLALLDRLAGADRSG